MSLDRRWQLIEFVPTVCAGGFTLIGAGDAGVNGRYCPDGEYLGYPRWTKVGGVTMADSVHVITAGPTSNWVVTSGGTYAADPLNVKAYSDFSTFTEPSPPDNTWITSTGGNAPAPEYAAPAPESLVPSVLRDFGPMQYAKFSEDEDLSVGCKALRRKLTTDLVFTGDDFDYFRVIERHPVRRCEEMIIRRQYRCGGMWKTVWTGTFSTGAGEWDLDNCEFAVKPDVLDEYTCIMRAMNKKVNVLSVPAVDTSAVIVSAGLQFGICDTASSTTPTACDSQPGTGGVGPFGAGWTLAHTFGTRNVYWREIAVTDCVGGTPVPPVGAGWLLVANNCSGAYSFMAPGTALYRRPPIISYTFGDPEFCPTGIGCCEPFARAYYWQDAGDGTVSEDERTRRKVVPFQDSLYRICFAGGATVDYNGRTLQSIGNFLLEKAGCDVAEMVSDLFEWNPPGDAPGYAAGINYVDGSTNEYNALVAVQNSDAADPGASNPATIGEMTLKEFLTLNLVGEQCYWLIDARGRLRIEHWKFWTTPVGLDLVAYANQNKSEPFTYSHLKSEIPRFERPKWQQAQGLDFIGVDIEYDGPCVSSEGENDVKEYNAGPFTTDLAFIDADPDAINKQGFTILATTFDGSTYNVIIGEGAVTGNFVTNAPMSWANLERTFWTWNRFLPSGMMNRLPTVFDGIQPNIEQKGVFVKLCCDYTDFDSSERVHTGLGVKLGGINAFVRRAEFDEATDGLTLTLRYNY
jgi:hypothetical protein